MADYSAYLLNLLDEDYPAVYNALIDELQNRATEMENGRQGQANLAANFARYVLYSAATANLNMANFKITGLGTPTATTDAVTKAYADGLSFAAALPSQTGNAGGMIETDGTTAFWSFNFARLAGSASQTFNMLTQAPSDRSNKGATTEFVQERVGLNAENLFYRG